MTKHRQYKTVISEKTSRVLKEFLGNKCPKPIHCGGGADEQYFTMYDEGCYRYMLHDLLSKPFCEAMCPLIVAIDRGYGFVRTPPGIYLELCKANYKGGLPSVEKALIEMMEAK